MQLFFRFGEARWQMVSGTKDGNVYIQSTAHNYQIPPLVWDMTPIKIYHFE